MEPCDICGDENVYVTDIRKMYRTKYIKAVCPACLKIIDKRLDHIRSLLADVRCLWFKRFIIGLKARMLKPKQEYIGDRRS